jgi:hypothetical protein
MSVGGSSQQQSGYQSGTYSGNQSGLNYGAQNATQTGSQNTNSSSTSSVNPNVPTQNQGYYNSAGANIGPDGLTAAQRAAVTGAPQPGTGSVAVQSSINDMNALKPGYATIAGNSYTPYSASGANAPTGASMMDAYESPYLSDVVNSTLANYDNNTANALNTMRASRDAGSAFGDRAAIADSVYKGQSDLGRGQLASSLLNQGFNTAAGFGQQDASNAANVSMFNAGQKNQDAQNNALNNFTQQGINLNALNSAGNNALNTSQLAQNGVRLNSDLSNSLFSMGGQGQNQLLNLFTAGNPLIGQTATNTGASTGSTTGTTSAENFGVNANQAAGQSSGTSSGQGSGKGGSVGASDIAKLFA